MDKLAGEFFVVAGALGSVLLAGWVLRQPLTELRTGASSFFARISPGLLVVIRYVVPVFVAIVLWYSFRGIW